MGPAPPYLVYSRAPKELERKRTVRSCGPGTPPSGTDLDKDIDDGQDKMYAAKMQNGMEKDRNKDTGKDLVECKICHRRVKGTRGLKIHLSKSKCGQTLEASQRKMHKSQDNLSLEEYHSAKVIQRRRLPFIVSQTYHRKISPQKVSIKQEKTAWIDFLKEQEEDVEEEKEDPKLEDPSQPSKKPITQKPITDFTEKPPDRSTIGDPGGMQLRSRKGRKMNSQSTKLPNKPQKKLTQYFGIKVKGESGLGEWLEEMNKINPEQPKDLEPREDDRGDSWLITDQWEESKSDTLEFTKKELDQLRKQVEKGDEKEVLALHHLQITRKDLRSLCYPNYVNDTIVDEYLMMIKARNPDNFVVLNSYFFQRLDELGLEEGMEQTKTWIKEDLRSKENILIPICKNDHWRLVHIDTKQKIVYYLDSIIGSRKNSSAPRIIKEFIEKYYTEKGEACQFKVKVRWDIPSQHNGVDCGVFLCAYAERISRRAGFNFSQSDMALFRWKITWEICNGSLKEWVRMKPEQASKKDQPKIKNGSGTKKKEEKKEEVKNSSQAEGRKQKIKWPEGNSKEWQKLDTDLSMILRKVGNTPEAKAELHPQLIYRLCLERFGEEEPAKKKKLRKPSRRQTKCQKLRQQINEHKDKWRQATAEEREQLEELQEENIRHLRILKRAESIRKRRRKYKNNSEEFRKQPYNFARKVLDPQVQGELESSKEEVQEFLRKSHSDEHREKELGSMEGLIQYPEPEFVYETSPPTFREFQAVLKKARSKSAPGPNGVPYKFYKKCPEVARLMFNYIKGL